MGVQFRGHEGEFTAHAYIISDPLHQQLTIWQPNDYQHIEIASLKDSFAIEEISNFKIAIFSAGTPLSIKRHLFEFKNLNPEAFCIFDPGQVAQFFTEDDMRACADLADMIVGNNIEFNYLRHLEEVQKNIQIETCGSRGALFRRDGEEVLFPAQIVDQVKNTTGAGDAFRAGMIHEIVNGARIEEAIEKGIELGAKCVQFNSAQYF
jgi:adenosine kinase